MPRGKPLYKPSAKQLAEIAESNKKYAVKTIKRRKSARVNPSNKSKKISAYFIRPDRNVLSRARKSGTAKQLEIKRKNDQYLRNVKIAKKNASLREKRLAKARLSTARFRNRKNFDRLFFSKHNSYPDEYYRSLAETGRTPRQLQALTQQAEWRYKNKWQPAGKKGKVKKPFTKLHTTSWLGKSRVARKRKPLSKQQRLQASRLRRHQVVMKNHKYNLWALAENRRRYSLRKKGILLKPLSLKPTEFL